MSIERVPIYVLYEYEEWDGVIETVAIICYTHSKDEADKFCKENIGCLCTQVDLLGSTAL